MALPTSNNVNAAWYTMRPDIGLEAPGARSPDISLSEHRLAESPLAPLVSRRRSTAGDEPWLVGLGR